MPRRRFLLILLLALSLPTFAQSLLIAAGAGYKRPVAELSELFQKQSGVRVEQIYGHMGGIVTQAAQSGDIAVVFGDRSYLATAGSLDFAGFQALAKDSPADAPWLPLVQQHIAANSGGAPVAGMPAEASKAPGGPTAGDVEAAEAPCDGHPWSAEIALAPWSALIFSQDRG